MDKRDGNIQSYKYNAVSKVSFKNDYDSMYMKKDKRENQILFQNSYDKTT